MEDGELKVEIGKMDLCVVIVVVGINLWLSHERKGIENVEWRIELELELELELNLKKKGN